LQIGTLRTQEELTRLTGRARRRATLVTGGLQFLRGATAAARGGGE
jgi:hypothetical protein